MNKYFVKKMNNHLSKMKKLRVFSGPSVVFNISTDSTLASLGREARERLEQIPIHKRKKIVYFPSYQHSKFVAIHDATIVLALQLRGAEVTPVLSGLFYQKEDVIYGGVYNEKRFRNQYKYSNDENTLFTSLLNTNPVSLMAFESMEVEQEARILSKSVTFETSKVLTHRGLPIGEMSEQLVRNMNNNPKMLDTPEHLEQFRWHIYNCVRLEGASTAILKALNPDAIVSNVPFYYKWRIPFEISQSLKIPFYSYVLGERKNGIAWTRNSRKLFDASPCWDSFRQSSMYENNQGIVKKGIEDRQYGRISHIPFLPGKNEEHIRINQIRSIIKGRPAILFPVNVLTDAAVLMPTPSFSSCLEMVIQVLEYFRDNSKYVCILKAHPAENILNGSGTDVSSMHLLRALEDHGIQLPENVIFIDYNEKMSSFNLYDLVQGLIAYTSSACMEISWFGKRSITAHDAHYSCAGFTYFPKSREDFFQELTKILKLEFGALPDPKIQQLGYAYYLLYYYINQIDYKLIEGNDIGTIPAKLLYNNIEALLPGNNKGLDYICDSILNKSPIFGENKWPPVTD